MNSRPPVKPTTVEPFKHVIDEYKHQAQTITCTCGWHGSSATLDRGGSEWTAHLFEVRGKRSADSAAGLEARASIAARESSRPS